MPVSRKQMAEPSMDKLKELINRVVAFRNKRNWAQYHTPRNLSVALSIEASELQEAFLWKSEEESTRFINSRHGQKAISEEVADVLIYALLFCHATGLDPLGSIERKLKINAKRYPVKSSKGKATKYTNLT